MHGHGACGAGLGGFHQEHQRNHGEEGEAEQPEGIDKRLHGGLADQVAVNESLGLVDCERGARSLLHQESAGAGNRRLVRLVERRHVTDQDLLMDLCPARQHGCDVGDADAAADVPRQVDDARGVVHLFFGNVVERHDVDGHKQKGHAHAGNRPGIQSGPEIDIEIEVRHAEQRERR